MIDTILAVAGLAMATIDKLVNTRATREAVDVLEDIEAVIAAVNGASTGKVTPQHAAERIHDLAARLKVTADASAKTREEQDAAADEKLRQRFADDGGKEP